MNPASALSVALRKRGRAVLVCASTGTDFAVDAVIAAKAAERRRSRFVNIFDIPSTLEFVLKRVGAARREIWRGVGLHLPRWLTMQNRPALSLPGCPLLARNGHADRIVRSPLSGEERKTCALVAVFRFW